MNIDTFASELLANSHATAVHQIFRPSAAYRDAGGESRIMIGVANT